ncbi:PIN domain-containing protein [Nostoc sp. CHAB 5824]|nr:PIN domain-containing protein [Nostoc sp. CHAB 5824]
MELFFRLNRTVLDVYGSLKGEIVKHFGPKNKAKRRKFTVQDLGFSDNDLWIASTALHYNLTVVSADSDFQRIQQVQNLSFRILALTHSCGTFTPTLW